MTFAEFKKKWHRYQGKETSAYQSHFDDLCRLFGQPTPTEADPSGNDFFCYQKGVIKDAELLDQDEDDGERPKKGFADVWKKDCFGWEYKGKHKNLGEAYKQLQRYRESLLNPPLLVVCDFDRYIVKTNFNGTVQEVHEFTNADIDRPENQRILRACFEDPEFLKPQRTTAEVTETLAGQIAEVARSLQKRESAEIADATTRKQVNFAQRRNLRIARFLNRIVFCFFAEDSGLLPKKLFSEIAKTSIANPHQFAAALEELFRVMAKGGMYGHHKIRHFNGHLFEEATVFELNEQELGILVSAAEADWQFIQPSIMGTLFERALEPEQRSQLGAHYTSEADIRTLVEPVLMQPLRREWAALKAEMVGADVRRLKPAGKKSETPHVVSYKARLESFQKKLARITVLDPACGSGNFLYVALQRLLDLEKEVVAFATQLGFSFKPQVGVQQLKAIEINPYAYELAQVSVQIGFLQWRRDNGFDNDRTPVLQVLDGFENKDALMHETFRKKPKNLKAARDEEHQGQDNLFKYYVERAWPECDVIVGNPPFLGGKLIRRELGDGYVNALFENFGERVPPEADLCCYWFEKARHQIEDGKCRRAGLLATQGIRGGANRTVLKRIQDTGGIFFAESDRDWILAGANVHVSLIGFDGGVEATRMLDGKRVEVINPNLTANADVTMAAELKANLSIAFMGTTKGGAFDIPELLALEFLHTPTPHGKPNSDVVVPWVNGMDLTQRPSGSWIIDYGVGWSEANATQYDSPFKFAQDTIKPAREKNNRETYRRLWWQHVEARPAMRAALEPLRRYLCTTRVSKFRLFVWLTAPTLPDSATFAFARADDFFFGVLHSRVHEVWARIQGTQVRERESGFRYTPTTCFETFPFPFTDDLAAPPVPSPSPADAASGWEDTIETRFLTVREEPPAYGASSSGRKEAHSSSGKSQSLVTSAATKEEHRAAIAAAAKELNELRERWLNPPEWTVEKILEFPGSVNGPWSRYIVGPLPSAGVAGSGDPAYKVGLVRYPRLEPRDAECAAKLKKRTLTNLYNERPAWLDLAHKKLDAAVAAAYGWPADLSDEQILEKLLALNLERAAEEARSAEAAKVKKPKKQRAKHAEEMI